MRMCVLAWMISVVFTSTFSSKTYGVVMTFDDITAGTEYDVGDTIVSTSIGILVGGSPQTNTVTSVLATTTAGGTGNELHNYADRQLIFQLPNAFPSVSFKYRNSGGTNFIAVNGVSSQQSGNPNTRRTGLLADNRWTRTNNR